MPGALRYAVSIAAMMCAGCAGLHRSGPLARPVRGNSAATAMRPAGTRADRGGRPSDADRDEQLASAVEPAAPDPLHDITLDQIREFVQDQSAVLIDARSPDSFAQGHVRGALNLPAGPVDEMAAYLARIRPSLGPDQLIILYCSSAACGSADMVAEYLARQGFGNTRVYSPGWQRLARAKDLR